MPMPRPPRARSPSPRAATPPPSACRNDQGRRAGIDSAPSPCQLFLFRVDGDALGDDLAVTIGIRHRDGISLPQVLRGTRFSHGVDASGPIEGERPLLILLP